MHAELKEHTVLSMHSSQLIVRFNMQGGIGSVLALTGAPDPDNINHLEIVVSTQYLEQQLGPASGNAIVSFLSNRS